MNLLLFYIVPVLGLALAGLTVALWMRARAAQEDSARSTRELEALESRYALLQSEQIDLLEVLRELPRLAAGPESGRRLRDIPEVLNRAVVRSFQPREAMIFLRRRPTSDQPERESQLILAAARKNSVYEPGQIVEIGHGSIGRLAERRKPTRGADLPAAEGEPRIDLGAPMMHGDKLLGVIALTDLGRQRSYDEDLLWLLANLGAYTLDSHYRLSQARTAGELDPLTQTYNRGALALRLAQAILRAESERSVLSILLFDIDQFKAYNERNGHLAGDELLREVARFVAERTRAEDTFGRFDGDRFLLVLPGRSSEAAELTGEKLRSAISRADFLFGDRQPKGRITISGGVASLPDDGAGSAELLEAAAEAIAVAKRHGRNQVLSAGVAADRDLSSAV